MPQNPLQDPISEPISATLEYNLSRLKTALRAARNPDVCVRRVACSAFPAGLVFMDGMVDVDLIDQHILRPLLSAPPSDAAPSERADLLAREVLTSAIVKYADSLDETLQAVLNGDTALFPDGCSRALVVETKGFAKRSVDQPVNETTISGPHEAFVENLKTNLSLLRRALRSPRLVCEQLSVGDGAPKGCSLVYLDGVCNEQVLSQVRRRVAGTRIDYVATIEELDQFIEDRPHALIPQFVHTERPDRVVSFLIDGMCVLLLDGSPKALAMPATLLHLLHSPDVSFLRYSSGTFIRLVAVVGTLLTVFLPGVYIALLSYHSEVLPLALMTSIYETQSRVPVPVFLELLLMGIAFDLINGAGARMPGALGQGLGVVSALVLGQAAVMADLVSPMLIIVVAISGLGSLIVGDYSLSVAFRILQLLFTFAAALGGLYGIALLLLVTFCELFTLTSMGVPFFPPYAPARMHNPDLLTRYPIWQQRVRMYLANPAQLLRTSGRARAWEEEDSHDR